MMPTRTLLLSFYLQSILFHQLNSNTKLWFDFDVLNATRNCDKHYKNFKQSVKETDKDKFKYAKTLTLLITKNH